MRRWTEVSAEPNSPEAKQLRRETLRGSRRTPVTDRLTFLQAVAKGKRVLDVGVVEHTLDTESKPNWLHRAVSQSAAYCLGVDILEADVKRLQAAGYNVRCADITRDDLGEQFEVIIVGEVIEHLSCPGKLFEAAQRLLLPGGRLVITTPNPYYWKRIRNAMFRMYRSRTESVDHVALLFPSGIAEMAERVGLELESYRGVTMRRKRMLEPVVMGMKRVLAGTILQGEVFCETLIYECRRS